MKRRGGDGISNGASMESRSLGGSPHKKPAKRPAPRAGVAVPSWYDLPLLVPDTDPVVGRLQRRFLETLGGENDPDKPPEDGLSSFVVPKVSRLSPARQTSSWRKEGGKMVLLRPRKTTQGGAAVVLDRLGHPNQGPQPRASRRRERLREKLWSDLSRFGLWRFERVGSDGAVELDAAIQRETATSVDEAVESIMGQLQHGDDVEEDEPAVDNDVEAQSAKDSGSSSSVFLTAVPVSTPTKEQSHEPLESGQSGVPSVPEDDDDRDQQNGDDGDNDEGDGDEEEGDAPADSSLAARFRRNIQAPGLKRRQRLKDLHVFVEKQLQKRLYRSWESIEIALAGSGDLSVHQIVKFLQNSDVKLSAVDAAKVQTILNQHLENQRVAKQQAEAAAMAAAMAASAAASGLSSTPDGSEPVPVLVEVPSAAPTKLSYAAFRKIFQPRDTKEAARWKREFDRDKVRLREEKEVYARELAALEEKVKRRLAESAKQMIELLAQFHCNPLALPWTSEPQRLELRDQFLRVIFSKPARRRLSQVGAAISASVAAASGLTTATTSTSATETSDVPEKLSVPRVLSALLQKYSRNGHFDRIDVPVAAYLFHDIAADAIKASIRALWKRRASDLWPERQLIFKFRLKKAVFYEWRRFTKHADVLRQYVLRKFVAWAFWTRKLHAYYAFYRACFWPFYVWKRHLQRMIIARGKSAFLKNVVLTYIQLRHFRAWKARFRKKVWCRRQVQRLRKKKARQVLRVCWHDWYERLRVHIHIHRLWRSQGHVLQRLHKGYMVKVTFLLWRYYSILQQDMAARRFKCLGAAATAKSRATRPPQGQRPNAKLSGGSFSPSRHYGQPAQQPPARSWVAASQQQPGTMGSRTVSMVSTHGDPLGVHHLDASADVFVHEDDDHGGDDRDYDDPQDATSSVRALSKIMETDLAPRIKRKTRLYDLCLNLFLRFRERDRRVMTGNVILFRRVARAFFRAMREVVSRHKKNRMATDLGAFRHLHRRFRWWVAVAIYKHPLGEDKENTPTNDDDDHGDLGTKRADAIALDWKRDTEWRQLGLANLPVEAERLGQDLMAIGVENAQRLERVQDLEAQLREKKRLEEVFLRKEAGATLKVRALQMQQAQQILRTRAHRLHDVLDRAFDALREQQRRQQLKASFRGLRVAMMERYTATLCHRAQLRNWLRLCRRFAFWQRHATRFCELRTKFHAFRALLRHAVDKWKHESPGLSARLHKRQLLLWKYDTYLERHGLLDGSPAASRIALTKYSPANSFHGVFLRWVQHTQLTKSHRELVAIARRKQELWRMHSVFQTLKTYLKAKYTAAARRRNVPFLYRQCVADLDAIHCKVLALRARLPSHRLRRHLKLTQHHLQQTATGAPTLKQLFQQHEQEIRHRLFLESRLLFVAYNERRVHNYAERSSALYGSPVGRSFAYEKAPPYGSISDVVVLCGKKVDAVSLVLKTNASVTVEGTLHGNPFGNREVFTLARGEKLVGIEGFASQTIYGLRFTASTGRLSKWFGHCEKGTKFELRSDWLGKREEIVGLFGYADATSLHALGAVFRHTTLRNIFEGMWLTPAPKLQQQQPAMADGTTSSSQADISHISSHATNTSGGSSSDNLQQTTHNGDAALCDRQFAYFLQVRMCDVLLAMKRAHRFALRVHRLAHTLPWALARTRVLLALMRWYFNSLTHGLVRASDREDEGRRVLQNGLTKRATGEKALDEGARLLAEVDSFRDSDRQLNVATLGVKKIAELKEMTEQGQLKLATGKRLLEEAAEEILLGRQILPHIPMTRRMMAAIRRMYKVVQTKDYIDQMDPELRAILLEGDAAAAATPGSIYDVV